MHVGIEFRNEIFNIIKFQHRGVRLNVAAHRRLRVRSHVDDSLFDALVFDIGVLALFLNLANKGKVDDLCKVTKGITGLLGVEVMKIDETILYTIANHVFTVCVGDKVWFVREVGRYGQKCFADALGHQGQRLFGALRHIASFSVFYDVCEKRSVIDIMCR